MTVDRDALRTSLRALTSGAPSEPGAASGDDLAVPLEQLTMATLAVPAAASAALSLRGDAGGTVLVALAGVLARAVDAAQAEAGDGPVPAALAGDRIVLSTALAEDSRWPRLARIAARLGAGGMVSVPVRLAGQPVGALSALAAGRHDWTDDEVAAVAALAGLAGHLLGTAVAAAGAAGRARVEQAKGVLMERAGIDDGEALRRLRATARSEHREVAEVAGELVETIGRHGTPAPAAPLPTGPLRVVDLRAAPAERVAVAAPAARSTARAAGTTLNGAGSTLNGAGGILNGAGSILNGAGSISNGAGSILSGAGTAPLPGPPDPPSPPGPAGPPDPPAPAADGAAPAAGPSGPEPLEPELAQLDRVLASALAGRSADRLLPGLLGPVARLAGADLVALLVADPGEGPLAVLRCRAAHGMPTGAPPERAVADGGLEGLVMESGVPWLVADLDAGPDSPVLAAGGARSAAAVPLLAGGAPVGVLLAGRTGRRPFSLRERAWLIRAAERVSAAVARVRIDELERRSPAEAGTAADRHARLAAVGQALAGASTPAEVAEIVVTAGVAALGAASGLLEVVAGDGQLELLAAEGYPPDAAEHLRRLPLDADQPLTDAVRQGRPLWLHDRDELARRYPALSDPVGDVREARACVPLVAAGRLLGMVAFGFDQPRPFEAGERTFVVALADLGARALDRAGRDAGDDGHAVPARERLAFRVESGALLSGSPLLRAAPAWRAAFDQSVWLAVPRLGDICVVMVASGGRLRPGGAAWAVPAAEAPLRALLADCAPPVAGRSPLAGVVRSGRSWHKAVVTSEILASVTGDPGQLARLEALGITSAMVVPLVGRVELLGVIVLAGQGARTSYRRADVAAAEELGRRAGLVLENGRRLGSGDPGP